MSVNYGEECVERLIPHVVNLVSKLNTSCKDVANLRKEVDEMSTMLETAENKCVNLNSSYKDKFVECNVLEDHMEARIAVLNDALKRSNEENSQLKNSLNELETADIQRIAKESEEKVAVLLAEQRCLLTTIEVLEADIKCLRADLVKLEHQSRERASSPNAPSAEPYLSLADVGDLLLLENDIPSPPQVLPDVNGDSGDFGRVLLIGDSLTRHASRRAVVKGAYLECCPGGKILDIKDRLLKYLGVSLNVIYFHVGTNNLRKGYRGGPGYNGGHGKREALHNMADLLYTVRTRFPSCQVYLNSVLIRRDLTYKALYDFNAQLELMCMNFGVNFVEANCSVGRRDLARDGVHLNRRGVSRLGTLFLDVITTALRSLEVDSPEVSPREVQSGVSPGCDPDGEGVVVGSHEAMDSSRVSGN